MFKKIFISTLLLLCISGTSSLVHAQDLGEKALQACIDECTSKSSSADVLLGCQNECRENAQLKKSYLPPIKKPTLLPGPKFKHEDKRTVQEVNSFLNEKLFPKIGARMITIVAITSMLGLIYSGILYFIAFGDPETGTKAKRTAIYSVVGLIIALLSFVIVQIIISLPV